MTDLASRFGKLWLVTALLVGAGHGVSGVVATHVLADMTHQAATTSSGIQISQAWSPPAPPTVHVYAGYLTVTNHSQTPQVMTGATSPQYEEITLHQTTVTDGVASMQPVASLSIAPGEQVQLAPGGLHLMLMGAKAVRHIGDAFPVTLHLQNGKTLTFDMKVLEADASSQASGATDHSMHQHHNH